MVYFLIKGSVSGLCVFVGCWFVLYNQFAGLFTINAGVFWDQVRELLLRVKNSRNLCILLSLPGLLAFAQQSS